MEHGWIRTCANDEKMTVQLSFVGGDSSGSVPALSVEVDDLDGALERFRAAGVAETKRPSTMRIQSSLSSKPAS